MISDRVLFLVVLPTLFVMYVAILVLSIKIQGAS